MILDKILRGILDQGAGCLIVYDEPEEDKTYESTLATLKTVGQVVDVGFILFLIFVATDFERRPSTSK